MLSKQYLNHMKVLQTTPEKVRDSQSQTTSFGNNYFMVKLISALTLASSLYLHENPIQSNSNSCPSNAWYQFSKASTCDSSAFQLHEEAELE